MTRTSTLMVLGLPSRSNSPVSSTRSSLACTSSGSSPISSRKSVEPSATSKRPTWRVRAPVKAPFSWPNSSLSTSPDGSAAQLTLTISVVPARAQPVDGLGDELLAGAGLAAHEHRGVRGRDLLDQAEDLPDGGALPDELDVRLDHLDLGLQVVALRLEPVLQSLDLDVGLAQALLALPPLRDVAENSEGPDRLPAGVAPGDAGQVMEPLLPASRVQVAVLDGEALQRALVQLLTPLQHAPAVVRMHVLDPERHGFQALP